MFDFLGKVIKHFVVDEKYVCRLIRKTARENLKENYQVFVVSKFSLEDIQAQYEYYQGNTELNINEITAYTCPFKEIEGPYHGFIKFNLTEIIKATRNMGFFDSFRAIKGFVLHELRHAEQFEFLRRFGGVELLQRVIDDQQKVPYYQNLFEMDAYAYQLFNENLDLYMVFSDYLTPIQEN